MASLLEKAQSLGIKPYGQMSKEEKYKYHQAVAKKFQAEAELAQSQTGLTGLAKKVVKATGFEKATDTLSNTMAARQVAPEAQQFVPQNTAGEKVGAALQIGSLLVPVGTAARALGGVVGKTAGNVIAGAGTGYAMDLGAKLSEGKTGAEAMAPGVGTAVGAAIPGVGALSRGVTKAAGKSIGTNSYQEALGQVLQGKTDDVTKGAEALKSLNLKGITKYSQLSDRIGKKISTLAQEVDDILGKDQTLRKASDLFTEMKTKSGKTVKDNFVTKALNHLSELYEKTGDAVAKSEIDDVINKANTEGLSVKEINDIARTYGQEFSSKAFNKVGDALTSVNAQMFENTRKGLKTLARNTIGGTEAKAKDELISSLYNTKRLIDQNVEAVAKLRQKAEKMGLGKQAVRLLIKAADTATLGGFQAIRQSFQQSNIGNKTLNWIGVEEALKKNLKIIEKAGTKLEQKVKAGKGFMTPGDILFEKVNGNAGMSIKDVSKDATKQVQYYTKSGWKTMSEIADEYANRTVATKAQALEWAREKVKGLQGRVKEMTR